MSWLPNTLGICRSIEKPRCCSPMASTSSARSWCSGWAMRRLSSRHSTFGCADSSLGSAKIAIDETVVPVLHPAVAAPRKDTSGHRRDLPALERSDPPAVAYSYAPGRAPSTSLELLIITAVSCNATETRPTETSPMQLAARRSRSPSVGLIVAAVLRHRQGGLRADRQRGA